MITSRYYICGACNLTYDSTTDCCMEFSIGNYYRKYAMLVSDIFIIRKLKRFSFLNTFHENI